MFVMIFEMILASAISNFERNGIEIETKQLVCMAKNIYYEARGESIKDQIYVANVTMNRVNDRRWGATICDVVYQPYQFSWTHENHKIPSTMNRIDKESWERAFEIAGLVMVGYINDYTNGATHYHRNDVSPKWADRLAFVETTSKKHIFYR
jgi:spore germination cell wall hydrolase CwlJ-like protein